MLSWLLPAVHQASRQGASTKCAYTLNWQHIISSPSVGPGNVTSASHLPHSTAAAATVREAAVTLLLREIRRYCAVSIHWKRPQSVMRGRLLFSHRQSSSLATVRDGRTEQMGFKFSNYHPFGQPNQISSRYSDATRTCLCLDGPVVQTDGRNLAMYDPHKKKAPPQALRNCRAALCPVVPARTALPSISDFAQP